MTVPAVQTLTEVVESKITQDKPVQSLSIWYSASWRKIVSEFIATTILVLFGCITCVPFTQGYEGALYPALGFGMTVMFNVQIFGHISGAHMNPAVTVSYMIFGGCGFLLGLAYIIAQCLGGIAGYGLLVALMPMDVTSTAVCVAMTRPDQTFLQSIGIEAAITSVLMLVNCALWDPVNKHQNDSTPVKFGLTILGLSLVGGQFTGASMNPARSLGPALWANYWADQWIYWVGPMLGSVVSTLLYKFIFLVKQKD